MSPTATLAPSRASLRAMARPMPSPRPAPVTTATLSFKPFTFPLLSPSFAWRCVPLAEHRSPVRWAHPLGVQGQEAPSQRRLPPPPPLPPLGQHVFRHQQIEPPLRDVDFDDVAVLGQGDWAALVGFRHP